MKVDYEWRYPKVNSCLMYKGFVEEMKEIYKYSIF